MCFSKKSENLSYKRRFGKISFAFLNILKNFEVSWILVTLFLKFLYNTVALGIIELGLQTYNLLLVKYSQINAICLNNRIKFWTRRVSDNLQGFLTLIRKIL